MGSIFYLDNLFIIKLDTENLKRIIFFDDKFYKIVLNYYKSLVVNSLDNL